MASHKLAFVADVHLANHARFGGEVEASLNRRARMVLQTLDRARARALEQLGVAHIFVLGDLFDTHNPIPQLIGAARGVMEEGGCWNLLMGNHDQRGPAAGDNALVAFGRSDNAVRFFEKPEVMRIGAGKEARRILVVPYGPGEAEQVLNAAVPDEPVDIVLLHAGVRDALTPPWLRDSPDSVDAQVLFRFMERVGARLALAGNWHEARRWVSGERAIYQVGSLCPTGFDNPGLDGYGLLVTVDPATLQVDAEEIPGPRFCKVSSPEQLAELAATIRTFPAGYSVFVEYQTTPDDLEGAAVRLSALVTEGLLAGWEVVPDRSRSEQMAREAAEAASQQTTTEQAVEAYVAHLDLPPSVSKVDLAARCIAFLKGRSGA